MKRISLKKKATAGMVEVKSRAYGHHLRAARGSKKPAKLNEVLTANAKRVKKLNTIGKEIHDVLKLYAGNFKEGMLWQNLLSRMHTAGSDSIVDLLVTLEDVELNRKYPLERFGNLPVLKISFHKTSMHIILMMSMPLRFKTKDKLWRYEVTVLFFNKAGKHTSDIMASSEWFAIEKKIDKAEFDIAVPKQAYVYVLCLRLKTGNGGEATDTLGSQGMRIMEAGVCGGN